MARLTLRLTFVCVLASLALTTATAKADLLPGLLGGNCGSTAQVFAPWGDVFSYYYAPNGGFESGANGWTLSGGAQVVRGSEPYALHSSADSNSLLLPAGSTASINTCFGTTYPSVRFLAVGASGNSATVHVRFVSKGLLGTLSVIDGGAMTAGKTWAPSPTMLALGSMLNTPVGTKTVQIQITASDAVQIDDLYVDPFLQQG